MMFFPVHTASTFKTCYANLLNMNLFFVFIESTEKERNIPYQIRVIKLQVYLNN